MNDASPSTRADAIARAQHNAPFLRLLIDQHPDVVAAFEQDGAAILPALVADEAGAGPSDDVAAALRHWRARVALGVALADLSGDADFDTVVRALSDFADRAADRALTAAFAERFDDAPLSGIAVIALGKQGSRELNYSSDIDPILIMDPATFPDTGRRDPVDVAVRLARRWVELLSARTADGYVLRVDLRLRPSPEVTPIVLPVDGALSYYESQALAWEQAAFIRARAAAGDQALGKRFLTALQPFVWRRSLDFGQLRRIGDITRRIRDHYADGQRFGPGFDIKRGRGGIREVEFFAQVQQLIHGGRNPALRAPATRDALAALAAAGHIAPDDAAMLDAAYVRYRTIEHRLQMVEDRQTHELPASAEGWAGIAALDGLADGAALDADLRPRTEAVARCFDRLLGDHAGSPATGWPNDAEQSAAAALAAGFADGEQVARLVATWRSGSMRVLRSPAARESLEAVLPRLLASIGRAPDPAQVLVGFDALIGGLPSAVGFFDLIAARERLLDLVVAVLAYAPTLASDLATRPDLIDGVIDASVFDEPADVRALAQHFARTQAGDYEAHLDAVRRIVGEHRFALGVQLVEGSRDPLHVARGYADIADAALESLTAATIAAFERDHGRIAGGELVVLALGRFGGRALTHASDLDLILLSTGDILAESDGRRPLGASAYFNRLGTRVIAALSVPTAAGRLYEVDVRLRPQGAQGPLVANIAAFARYQREEAWTWEHMALTRARVVYGSPAARAAVEGIIADTLDAPRDTAKLIADIAHMRGEMARHKPPRTPLDVKLIEGGLVDVEFAIHAVQLGHRTAFDPRLNVALARLVAEGLAPADAPAAMDLLGRMLVTMRLMAPDLDPADPATRARIADRCGFPAGGDGDGWPRLLEAYTGARGVIGDWWRSVSDGG